MADRDNETLAGFFSQWRARNKAVDAFVVDLQAKGASSDQISSAVEGEFGCSHHWPEALVRPIADVLVSSGVFPHLRVLGPFGVGATIALHAYPTAECDKPHCSINFRPNLDPDEGESCLSWVDYSRDTGRFKPETLGHLNGLQFPEVPVPMETRISDVEYWRALMERDRAALPDGQGGGR